MYMEEVPPVISFCKVRGPTDQPLRLFPPLRQGLCSYNSFEGSVIQPCPVEDYKLLILATPAIIAQGLSRML